jgi:hypothetical protein
LTVPIFAFTISIWGADFARDCSRNIAINNAEKLITAIENYKDINERYPYDIIQLKPDFIKRIPKPGIMGISGFNYKNDNNSYVLTFTQNVLINFNFEVVVYDPTGNHKAEGELQTLYTTGKDKWKYYIYD